MPLIVRLCEQVECEQSSPRNLTCKEISNNTLQRFTDSTTINF